MVDILKEPLLFRVGYAFEQATKWKEQHPDTKPLKMKTN